MRMIDNDAVGLKTARRFIIALFELHIQECAGSLLPEGAW